MKLFYITITALVSAASLQAASVSITNHSFETGAGLPPAPPATVWNNNTPDGWTSPGGIGLQNTTGEGAVGNDGDIVVFIQTGSIAQNITGSILGNSVSVGDVFTLTVAATDQNGAPDFEFDIQDDFGASLIGGPVTSTTLLPDNPIYTDAVLTGTVDTDSPIALLVIQRTGGQVRIDNVRLDLVQVPEPSSAALLGLGGLALILRRKK
ncbi:MAG: PEP-CTERM sorting domain-containing protein [Akkermansiaceae bacterium]